MLEMSKIPDAAQTILADGLRHTLDAAVDPAGQAFTRDEQQVLEDRDVALRCGQT